MWAALRKLLGDASPARPAGPSPWDRRLVVALAPVVVGEGLLRDGLALRPLHIAFGLAILVAVLFRRPAPLGATAAGFGLAMTSGFVLRALGAGDASLHSNATVLLLPYTLLRWGAARDVVLGAGVLVVVYASSLLRGEMHGFSEGFGAAVVMLFPGALGASARFRAETHAQELAHVKLRERAELARDLHDTVAHHVAAIVIQAQAGRAVLATRPEATGEALDAIAKEATRTLAELRGMVGALREDRAATTAPQPTLEDLPRLARAAGGAGSGLAIEVAIDGAAGPLLPAAETALFRIAQESITNAMRHAKDASRVRVRVTTEKEGVRMTVEDDGATPTRRGSGFGLVGMAERAALLGGRLVSGPRDGGGWSVDVTLPFERSRR